MRTVYLGTSAFAAAILARLADSPHRPQLVVTRPDRPKGRGRRLQAPPVAERARELGIELDQPEDVNGEAARERIAAARPDAVIVCAFGALIRGPLLADHEILNVHPSLLPRWRGAAPLERAIMAGDTETGVAIMRLTAGLDSGPVALVQRTPIGASDTYGTLAPRLERIGGDLLVRALDERPPYVEQPEEGITYAEKIGPEDRTLDPLRQTAVELDRVVRALTPHIGARLPLPDGSMLGVGEARVFAADPPAPTASSESSDGRATASGAPFVPPAPGTLIGYEGKLLVGAAAGSVLELVSVQPPGGRAMGAGDYLRGRGLPG